MKYLLSSGRSSDSIEEYIIDLFRLYLQVWPNDIPGLSDIGFDFILSNVKRPDMLSEVSTRLGSLVDKLRGKFSNVDITIDQIELLSESRVRVTLTVNNKNTEKIVIEV